MTSKPFLARYSVHHAQAEGDERATYDAGLMLLVRNGLPAILDPSFTDDGNTFVTEVKRETTDDR